MSSLRHFDLIIAGAGASGLSLLHNILQSGELAGKRILLADRSLKPVRNKTWCFWDQDQALEPAMIYHKWPVLEIKVAGSVFSERLQNHCYQCVRSDKYAEIILDKARQTSGVVLMETEIRDFEPRNGQAVMHTSDGPFTANRVFQSALRPPGFNRLKLDLSLKQHFRGWQIRTLKPVFDPEKALFMDFEVPQEAGVTFVYVLPFSPSEALVEYTLFSEETLDKEKYEQGLKRYIESRLNLGSGEYEVIYTEKGIIPMEDRRYPGQYCDRVWNMGTMGGLTKPSTGYTFTRIQQHARQIASSLARGNEPPGQMASSYRYRVYDMLLLYNLHADPKGSLNIFHELFRNNRLDRILEFLEEKTQFHQDLRIMASVPWFPFFRAIYKMKRRIFTGA